MRYRLLLAGMVLASCSNWNTPPTRKVQTMVTLIATYRAHIDPENTTGTLPTQVRDFSWTVTGVGLVQGTYWNGRPWVYVPSGGSLTVDAVTPAQIGSGATTYNGSVKNPRGSATKQGVDGLGEIPSFAAFDSTLTAIIPGLTMVAGDTLITTLSRPNTPFPRLFDGDPTGNRPGQTDSAGVLYVVGVIPPVDAFAPNWGGEPGAARLTFNFSQVRQNLLPVLILPPGNPTPPIDSELIFFMNTLWLDLIQGWNSLYTEGHDDAFCYGQLRANVISMALCRCLINQGSATQQALLKHVIQHGIDYWGLQRDGKRHDINGGHFMGRKAVVVFAGTLLDDPIMAAPIGPLVQANTGVGGAATGHWFQEDVAHYFDSTLGSGDNWKGGPGCWRYNLDANTDTGPQMDASQVTGYQHLAPSLWGGGPPTASPAILFHENTSYYLANHEEKVGQTLIMLAIRAIENWDGTISHTRGHRRTVAVVAGVPADNVYTASKAYFCDMIRFMSPHVPEIDSALIAAGVTLQKQGGSNSFSALQASRFNQERKRWIRDLWCANFLAFPATGWVGAGSARGVMGPEIPNAVVSLGSIVSGTTTSVTVAGTPWVASLFIRNFEIDIYNSSGSTLLATRAIATNTTSSLTWVTATTFVPGASNTYKIRTVRGALDRPLLATVDRVVGGNTVTLHCWSGLTPGNLPAGVTVTNTWLEKGYPLDVPVVIQSAGVDYYHWYSGTASAGIGVFGVEGGSGAALGEDVLAIPNVTNGYTSASLVLPALSTSQTWYCFQILFKLSNLELRTSNALLCLI